jgi:hypothetical protein
MSGANVEAKPIVITGTSEADLPATHCGGYEINWFERWAGMRPEYRCTKCLQRFRLRKPRGYEPPLGSFYD